MTLDDVERLLRIFEKYSSLKWCVIAAGLAAVTDMGHIVWLASRYLLKF